MLALFLVSSVLRLTIPSQYIPRLTIPRLICSVSHLFCGLSFQCITYSVSQDLDRFPTLRLCLDFKPRLGINHA